MKKVLYSLLAGTMMLASCSDFTDIPQKGKNLLSSVDDIELLFNKEYDIWNQDMRTITGVPYNYSSLAAVISQPNKSRTAIMYSYDENLLERFEQLTTSDSYYTELYGNIGKVANPVISQLENATGTDARKNALKAEALTLRAYSHYMLLQKYAKAYTSATANDPSIVYLTEDVNIQEPQEPKTIKEAYELCLKDVNAAIELNALPENAVTETRFNKGAAYAAKAHICLGMGDYAGAVEAAKQALGQNDKLYDYYANIEHTSNYYGHEFDQSAISCFSVNPENYWAMPNNVYYALVNPGLAAMMEPTYGVYALYPKASDTYKGISAVYGPAYADYETDYCATLGCPGWDMGDSFDFYSNDSGLNVGNMYLVIVEALIKSNEINSAMEYLDKLRKCRIDPAVYAPLKGSVTTKADAIKALKADYIGENVWSWWNFIGMKRWNTDPEWQVTLSHTIGGNTYTIKPSSPFWVFPFPANVTSKNPYLKWNK